MKSRDAATIFEQEIDSLIKEYEAVPAKAQAMTLAKAKDLSSGTISSKRLAQMGHPYGRNYQGPHIVPVLPINKQAGGLIALWKPGQDSDGLTVENRSPYIQFLNQGTKKMIARPIGATLQDFADNAVETLTDEVTDRWNDDRG